LECLAAPELCESGRRSATGPHIGRIRPKAKRIRHGELGTAFLSQRAGISRKRKKKVSTYQSPPNDILKKAGRIFSVPLTFEQTYQPD